MLVALVALPLASSVQAHHNFLAEFDPAKRVAIYTKALNRVNELAYIVPLAELPTVWAHGKDVKVSENPLSAAETRLGDWSWN